MAKGGYIDAKIRAALHQAHGDTGKAQRLMRNWAARDLDLLRALAAPFIDGMVAHAIAQHRADRPPRRPVRTDGRLSQEAFSQVVGQLERTVGASSSDPKGVAALVSKPRRVQAGRRHTESLHQIALAFARKRFDP